MAADGNFDGSIKLNVKTTADAKSVTQTTKELERSISSSLGAMSKKISKLPGEFKKVTQAIRGSSQQSADLSKAVKVDKLRLDLRKAEADVKKYRDEIHKLSNEKVRNPEYDALFDELSKCKIKAQDLREVLASTANGTPAHSNAEEMLAKVGQRADEVKAKMHEMYASGTSMVLKDNSPQIDKLKFSLDGAEIKVRDLQGRLANLDSGGGVNKTTSKIKGLKVVILGIIGAVKKLVKHFSTLSKNSKSATKNMTGGFNKGLKGILKWGFGIKSFFILFKRLRQTVVEGLKDMGNSIPAVQSDINRLSASFKTLKASLATAFQPILTAVTPALVSLMNTLTNVINKVAEFMAAITGQKFIYKANAKAASEQASATKEAAEANKELYKSGLDTNNNYTDNSKASGAGGAGGAGGGSGITYEKQDVSKDVEDFVKQIKDAWAKADFTDIGKQLGEKLKGALQLIPWEEIKGIANKAGKSFATLINGFVEVPDLGTTIGKTVGEAINTGLQLWKGFVDNAHFASIGKFLGDGVFGTINTIDWNTLGSNVGKSISGLFEMIGGAISKWNPEELGKKLSTGINSIFKAMSQLNSFGNNGWEQIGKDISDGLRKAMQSLTTFVQELDVGEIGKAIVDAICGINWGGLVWDLGNLVSSLFGALVNAVLGVLEELGVKVAELLGMDSGTIKAIRDGFTKIRQWVTKFFKDWNPLQLAKKLINGIIKFFKTFPGNVKTIFKSAVDGVKKAWSGVKNFFKDIWTGITKVFGNVGSWFKDKFKAAWNGIKNIWNGVKGFFSSIWKGITSVFGNVGKWFKDKFSTAWNNIKAVFQKGGSVFVGIKDAIGNIFKQGINKIIGAINTVLSKCITPIKNGFDKIRNVEILGAHPFSFLPNIKVPQIPKLAKGGVIPPNKEFLAVLGDQTHGTNIETPLSTMVDAFNIALDKRGGQQQQTGGNYEFVAKLNRRTLFDEFIDEAKLRKQQSGKNPLLAI